jgi:hypothetical protein
MCIDHRGGFRGGGGADPGFQVRGGTLKKIAPSRGRHEIFGVFRVKNHDFTPKNHIFTYVNMYLCTEKIDT